MQITTKQSLLSEGENSRVQFVGQCDLDLGSSHYIRADTGLPQTLRLLRCKHPGQPDMLDAINYATK